LSPIAAEFAGRVQITRSVLDNPHGRPVVVVHRRHGLPFVFDMQLLEGTVPVHDVDYHRGAPLTLDRMGAGVVGRGQMRARNGVFGYNLSR
jgi:hypothetical protein